MIFYYEITEWWVIVWWIQQEKEKRKKPTNICGIIHEITDTVKYIYTLFGNDKVDASVWSAPAVSLSWQCFCI